MADLARLHTCNACKGSFPGTEFYGRSDGGKYTCKACVREKVKRWSRLVCWAINMGMSEWGEAVYKQVASAYLARLG